MDDPLYFIQTYVQIVSLDEGFLIPFKMYPFQKEMVGTFHKKIVSQSVSYQDSLVNLQL